MAHYSNFLMWNPPCTSGINFTWSRCFTFLIQLGLICCDSLEGFYIYPHEQGRPGFSFPVLLLSGLLCWLCNGILEAFHFLRCPAPAYPAGQCSVPWKLGEQLWSFTARFLVSHSLSLPLLFSLPQFSQVHTYHLSAPKLTPERRL